MNLVFIQDNLKGATMSYVSPNVLASGTTFSQFQAGGASGHLERLIAANAAASGNPTVAATVSANGGGTVGGQLAPGTYNVNFTETNGYGETLPSAESGPIAVTAQSAPSGTPTVSVSGSGGTLPVGVYYGKFTYVDSYVNYLGNHGETTAGTEFTFTQTSGAQPVITINDGGLPAWASGRNLYLTAAGGGSGNEVLAFSGITAATYTIAAAPAASTTTAPASNTTTTVIPKITAFPALQSGNVARNIYLTPVNGGSGSETLYLREQTASTFVFSVAQPTNSYSASLPTSNTTGLSQLDYQMLRSVKDGNLEDVYRRLRQVVYEFNHGSPLQHAQGVATLKRVHLVFAALAELCLETGLLVDANPGHFTASQTGIGEALLKRVWP
jgi:hypothetical protein